MSLRRQPPVARAPRYGLARILSKRGLCSRSEAEQLIRAGRVRVDGRCVNDPEFPADLQRARIEIDAQQVARAAPQYLMLNKPRGLVTTTQDEHGRDTVYRCFDGADLGWIAPVGRLDKASEGLLLFTNDPQWAARITSPESALCKTYHVQVTCIPTANMLQAMQAGVTAEGELLRAKSVRLLRAGEKYAWLEIVLDEGRNRQIRRLLAALEIGVLRLVRVAIGPLVLGELPKGQWRALTAAEAAALSGA
ncbi:MAG: rRNA pseudouridine synthase [Thermomonas sp.]|uniref:pseudouridine synthase n=1 Tax=Thermomonas sp. TaxID=1971895 RepID=UPI001EB90A93|nr:pseudouridine synthase [Thermomonas sp.]MBV2210077.1 rRNA pseudouridine synthase [Thermomonas sp.]